MQRAGLSAEKVPCRIVRGSRLRDLVIRRWLDCVDQVGKEDGILDEKDGDVVANNVLPTVSLFCAIVRLIGLPKLPSSV